MSSSITGSPSMGAKIAIFALIALTVTIVVIIPPAVVETPKHNKNNAAGDNSNGFTTIVSRLTTFIQTKTADVITRSSLLTLANGEVSTITSEVTIPTITVSQTSVNAIQTGVITTTIGGEVVVLATRTSYVEGEGQAAMSFNSEHWHDIVIASHFFEAEPAGDHLQLLGERYDPTHRIDFRSRNVDRILVFVSVLPGLHCQTSRVLGRRVPDHDAELNRVGHSSYDSLVVVIAELDYCLHSRLQLSDIKRFSA
ncbi:hypothetical protein JCM21900_006085 [Sporobolomyces salmonicolor]